MPNWDDKEVIDTPIYTPPTREALVRSMYSDGIYSAVCRKCKVKIRGKNIDELKEHKCQS